MVLAATSPLLDLFKAGEVPQDVRLLAARGALCTSPAEQLALLIHLEGDSDPGIAATARQTFASIPREALARFLARTDCPADVRAACAARGVDPAVDAASADDVLIPAASDEADAAQDDDRRMPLTSLPITDKIKIAMRGTREQRSRLVRDPNKLVAVAVLSSPKLTEAEVEQFAKMGNVSEEVLRIIGNNRAWVRSYPVMAALCKNPKTPLSVSLRLVGFLNARDVKMITTDRNLPEQVRLNARKFMAKYGKG